MPLISGSNITYKKKYRKKIILLWKKLNNCVIVYNKYEGRDKLAACTAKGSGGREL
jgi:hypothetical protein